jgi:hypothetical protein
VKKVGSVIILMILIVMLSACGSGDMAVQNGQELDRDAMEWVIPEDVEERF